MSRPAYHPGHRELQDHFDSRRLADRLEEKTYRATLSGRDRAAVEGAAMFFIATADPDGFPDCSYKGGGRGFVRVLDEHTLEWPDYDGNGQFRTLGNLRVNPKCALLFIDFERQSRLRVHGIATVDVEARVVRFAIERVFPNCPRYIHKMSFVQLSEYVPVPGEEPPVPGWKRSPDFCDVLPEKKGG